jgi:tagatose-1,6-bisphosphate aldolase non-catalytic subunit AgaZ/GatZ
MTQIATDWKHKKMKTFKEYEKARKAGYRDQIRIYQENKERVKREIEKLKNQLKESKRPKFMKATKEDFEEYRKFKENNHSRLKTGENKYDLPFRIKY